MSDMTNSVLDSKAFEEKVNSCCKDDSGIFMLFVLDERCKASGAVSDSVLAKLISAQVTESDTVGKIESGELAAFFKFQIDPLFPEKFTDKLNESLKACEGADDTFGVFSGAVFAPENGKDFAELYRFARKALDSVVSENKHGTAVYSNYSKFSEWRRDLASASKLFDESDVASGACRISPNGFGPVYRYFVRYVQSYCRSAFKMLFTLSCIKEPYNGMSFISERFSELIAQKLRKSDLLVQLSDDQFFLVLPEINEQDAHKLAQRIVNVWENSDFSDGIELQYEASQIPIDVDSQKHFRSSDK